MRQGAKKAVEGCTLLLAKLWNGSKFHYSSRWTECVPHLLHVHVCIRIFFSKLSVGTTPIAARANIILKQLKEGKSLPSVYYWPLKECLGVRNTVAIALMKYRGLSSSQRNLQTSRIFMKIRYVTFSYLKFLSITIFLLGETKISSPQRKSWRHYLGHYKWIKWFVHFVTCVVYSCVYYL